MRPEDRLALEAEIAQRVQLAFLPTNCPQCEGLQIAARHRMAQGLGGDLYDFIPIDDHTSSVVIGDVIGHDLRSALTMSLIFGAVHTAGARAEQPIVLLTLINELLCELNSQMAADVLLCSLCHLVIDRRRGTLRYANAGHPPPLLWRDTSTPVRLQPTTTLLGVQPQCDETTRSESLTGARHLLLYTDGITEARDPSGSFFDERRIKDAVSAAEAMTPAEVIEQLLGAVERHTRGDLADDATAIMIRFTDT